jgi:hypothetical protein
VSNTHRVKSPLLACTSGALVAACFLLGPGSAGAATHAKTPPQRTVLAVRGSGNASTHTFKISAASWHVGYAFQCITQSAFGFQVKRAHKTAAAHTVVGSGFAKSGTTNYKESGSYSIVVKSADHCEWLLRVTQPKT